MALVSQEFGFEISNSSFVLVLSQLNDIARIHISFIFK